MWKQHGRNGDMELKEELDKSARQKTFQAIKISENKNLSGTLGLKRKS